MNTAIPQASLQIVSDELAVTLNDTRVVLEQYAEGEGGPQALERAAALLHTARGVLRMTETHGASLLAEEMELTCAHLAKLKRRDGGTEEPLEALMRAAAQLPAYVERVLNGGRDIPLVLLPLLNDLRAARGRPLLSESTLLLLNVGTDPRARGGAVRPPASGEDLAALCQDLRPRFQLALLGWIRGEDAEGNLRRMHGVAERLEQAASAEEVHQLWWVVAGILESLLDQGLETSVSLKRLMGQVDREIKRLRTLGETQFAKVPPTELVNNFLYYVARARTGGPRVTAIRAAFNLSDLVPGDAQVEQARQNLSAPSVKLMQTVAQAIRDDLGRVKDVLDIFVRTGMERVEELAPQLELLKKIGDTLGVLGLGDLREVVQARREELQELIAHGRRPDEAALVAIAAALLGVEDRLESDLIGMIAPRAEEPTVVAVDAEAERPAGLSQVLPAVMRECLVNLARVKDAVTQVIARDGDAAALDAVGEQLQGIGAGLMMLGKERAVAVVDGLQRAIRGLVGGRLVAGRERLDRLADATVSLEYYLETLQAGRSDPNYMLDNAERCLAGLEPEPGTEPASADPGAANVLDHAETIAATVAIRPVVPPDYDATQVIGPAAPVPESPPEPPPVFSGGPERLDPELLELFIEEAREEIAGIGRSFPAWERDDADGNALVSLRRSFHTLKGSGRMVGAEAIGEFCWAVERLLNQVIDGTVRRSPALVATLGRCIAVLPGLLEQLETGSAPRDDVPALLAALEEAAITPAQPAEAEPAAVAPEPEPEPAIEPGPTPREATGTAPATAQEQQPAAAPPEPVAAPGAPAGIDPVLLDILTREVTGHLGVLRRYVARCDQSAPPHAVPEDLYRSCHTLNGSLAMARVEIGLPLTDALNALVSLAYNRPARLPPGAIDTLRDCAARIEALLAYLAEPWRPVPETADLEQRLRDHQQAIEHPEPEAVETTGELAQLDVALIAPESQADASSIIVEELAMPDEVIEIELTSELPLTADLDAVPEPGPEFELEPGVLSELVPELVVPETVSGPGTEPELEPEQQPEPEPEPGPTLVSAPTQVPPPSALPFDAEIAAIFAEEAAELLETADRALAGIADRSPTGAQAMADLQRCLHTLKGGARMAGLGVMGDFSHDLETLLIRVNEGLLPHTADVDALLQASLDELHRLREDVLTGDQRPVAAALTARVAAAMQGQVPAATPVVTTPEPVAAPAAVPVVAAPGLVPVPPLLPEPVVAAPEPLPEPVPVVAPADTLPVTPPPAVPEIELPALDRLGELARELEQPVPAGAAAAASAPEPATARTPLPERRETARVDSVLLDHLLNNAGEISIFQSRLGQQVNLIQFNLEELGATVVRLREQLRKLELETEAQILFRHQDDSVRRTDFDPLELDRYSTIQQLSRGLAESTTDVNSLKDLLQNLARDTEALLVQQGRTATELQDGLMRTRMVPFQQHAPRLARLVRQTAMETGKRAELQLQGGGELDRQVLERMLGPFEHMLRNAVIHGIETPAEREAARKPASGSIFINLRRDGSEAVVEIADDGRGLDVAAIRRKAIALGFLAPDAGIGDDEAMQFILRPGFSTADRLTQAAGRGIGMDVVTSEVARLGGSLRIGSVPGRGTTFTIRLPFTLAVTQALIVRVAGELYALPLPTVEGVIRISRGELLARLGAQQPTIEYGGQAYHFRHLGEYLGLGPSRIAEEQGRVSVILVRAGEHSTALVTDDMQDSREIVVKPVGPQLATIRGIAGATILGDGRIAVILDMGILVRTVRPGGGTRAPLPESVPKGPLALVVDDSITMRRVTQRLLERNGFRVVTAKDGMEAIGVLQDHRPDIILLDVEMPRMDGYEFAKHVRNNADTAAVPIVMITSRVSDKHRARAIEVGVNDYLGKPYQERALLEAVRHQLKQE
ncbi:MAG: Hpt domain-containing protein [Gammaproteobacteria bacterium]|nr:Hpt domain-containing protein [Gammaproteobacteria bacterium]